MSSQNSNVGCQNVKAAWKYWVSEAKKNKKAAEIQRKTVDAINKCKEHGGPTACPKRLKELTTDQLKNEIAFLKMTNGQHIRYKHEVGNNLFFQT